MCAVWGTPAEAEVVKAWRQERGQFYPDEIADYASYDIAMLEKRAESGDAKAMSVLADKHSSPGHAAENQKTMKPQLGFAAIHGSTKALEDPAVIEHKNKVYPIFP